MKRELGLQKPPGKTSLPPVLSLSSSAHAFRNSRGMSHATVVCFIGFVLVETPTSPVDSARLHSTPDTAAWFGQLHSTAWRLCRPIMMSKRLKRHTRKHRRCRCLRCRCWCAGPSTLGLIDSNDDCQQCNPSIPDCFRIFHAVAPVARCPGTFAYAELCARVSENPFPGRYHLNRQGSFLVPKIGNRQR